MTSLIQVNRKDFPALKKKLLKQQGYKCAISGRPLEINKEAVIDHKHKLNKNQPIGENDAGLIRGVLDFRVNAFEGKVVNVFRRLGLHKFDISLPDLLRNLANYLETPATNLIHPSEKPKAPKINKRDFNKIANLYLEKNPKNKPLQYPKSGKLTKKLQTLVEKYNI